MYSCIFKSNKFKLNTVRITIDKGIIMNTPRAIFQKGCICLPSLLFLPVNITVLACIKCCHRHCPYGLLFLIDHSFDYTYFQKHYWNKDKHFTTHNQEWKHSFNIGYNWSVNYLHITVNNNQTEYLPSETSGQVTTLARFSRQL